MYDDGRDGSIAPGTGSKGNLLFTLCKPCNLGGQTAYPHFLVEFPDSYHEGKLEAARVFSAYLPKKVKLADITLKCAMKRENGTMIWADISPDKWNATICGGNEIGVFLPDDPYAPYEAGVKSTINNKPSMPAKEQKMIVLTFLSTKVQVLAPKTLPELKKLAKKQFRLIKDASQINITVTSGTSAMRNVALHDTSYSQFMATAEDSIELAAF